MNILLILLIALGIFLIYQKSKGKSWKNIFGYLLLVMGILFIEPLPNPITFSLYAISHGLDVSTINSGNLVTHLWQFELWSVTIGIFMVLFATYILGWNLKKIWNKLDIGKYKIALFVAALVVVLVSILDIYSAHSNIFGSFIDYTYGYYSVGWWDLFFKFILVIFIIPPICYYTLVHKDKSEALGIFLFSLIIYFGGLSDVGYFVLQGLNIPSELPWLVGSPVIGFINTQILGYSTVTNFGLLFSVFVSLIVAILTAKILKEYF